MLISLLPGTSLNKKIHRCRPERFPIGQPPNFHHRRKFRGIDDRGEWQEHIPITILGNLVSQITHPTLGANVACLTASTAGLLSLGAWAPPYDAAFKLRLADYC
jgi:hypothetical protein